MKRTPTAVKERPQPTLCTSPHLLDLTPAVPTKPPRQPNVRRSWWRLILDERIHLRDLRHRSVSVRPRGWRDFPAAHATNLAHAAVYAVERFLKDHPLADLTIISVAHFIGLTIWYIFVRPFKIFAATQAARQREPRPVAIKEKPVKKTVQPRPAPPIIEKQPEPARVTLAGPSPLKVFAQSALAFILFILPFGAFAAYSGIKWSANQLMDDARTGFALLEKAGHAAERLDFIAAHASFAQAASRFSAMKQTLGGDSFIEATAAILPATNAVFAAPSLLDAAEAASRGGAILTEGLSLENGNLLKTVTTVKLRSRSALPYLREANEALSRISADSLPRQYRDRVTQTKEALPRLITQLNRGTRALGLFEYLLGNREPRRFLLVFQNSSELRPTGGFIGSYALVDVKDGAITKLDIPGGGSYDLQGSLSLKLAAPQPLRLVNPQWQFQDANWDPDFATSARRIATFFEKSGQPTTDGVIAVNDTVIERLLAVTGPIALPEYDKLISAENFRSETQKAVELEYDKEKNKPKQFLADLAPKLLERLLSADARQATLAAAALEEELNRKGIQLWFKKESAQTDAASLGWSGEISRPTGDYLAVVHANIAGQKTDQVMSERVSHDVVLQEDGSAVATVTVMRTHTGKKGEAFTGVRNVDYVRFYVPSGSELLSATGFQAPDPKLFKIADASLATAQPGNEKNDETSGTAIAEENGHAVFGNWVQTDPGHTSFAAVTYRLPAGTFNPEPFSSRDWLGRGRSGESLGYTLTVQKQSGSRAAAFESHIHFPSGYTPARSASYENENGALVAKRSLIADTSFSVNADR